MLEAIGLACVRGERMLFRDLHLRLQAGAVVWVTGQNGSGKTSLLRLLCGLSRPAAGEVRWRGERIDQTRDEFHEALVYLGHLNALKADLSAEENLRYLLRVRDGGTKMATELQARGLGKCLGLPSRVLSQGQKRRVALARVALSRDRPLWILDEPFAALDSQALADLSQLIASHANGGGMVVLTSHQEVALAGIDVARLDLASSKGAA